MENWNNIGIIPPDELLQIKDEFGNILKDAFRV